MSSQPGNSVIERHFITVRGQFGTRQVHYRRGGQGPVVLLLHQSPQSSREMEPVIRAWGDAFTLIAPDAPGYGYSQPLQAAGRPVAEASIDDFAAATLEFADTLGIGRFAVYGFHTGASIGVALAHAYPNRLAAVVANGLVVPTNDELNAILREYLPPLVPRWDGGHLAWLWARMREQTVFFPWHDRRAATRMEFDMPPANRLQDGVQEFLAAAEHYHVAYRAAFTGHAERRLPTFRVPLLVTAAARDPIAGHLARIDARSDTVQVVQSGDPGGALERAFAHLARYPGDPGEATNRAPIAASVASEYHGAPGQQVRVQRTIAQNAASGRIAILLHPPGGSASSLDTLPDDIAAEAHVLAVDLPGHGASDPAPVSTGGGSALAGTVTQLAAALNAALPAAGSAARQSIDVVAVGSSAPVAIELARQLDARASDGAVVLLEPPAWSLADIEAWLRNGLPALEPVWSGGHLLEAWHLVRDSRLYTPWFRRQRTAIRPGEPDLNEERIHRDVRDLLRSNGAWQALLRDVLGYGSTTGRLPGHRVIELKRRPGNWREVLAPTLGQPEAPS